jgi:hypothetical protein
MQESLAARTPPATVAALAASLFLLRAAAQLAASTMLVGAWLLVSRALPRVIPRGSGRRESWLQGARSDLRPVDEHRALSSCGRGGPMTTIRIEGVEDGDRCYLTWTPIRASVDAAPGAPPGARVRLRDGGGRRPTSFLPLPRPSRVDRTRRRAASVRQRRGVGCGQVQATPAAPGATQ